MGKPQIIFIMYTVREVFNTNTSLDRMGWIILAGTTHMLGKLYFYDHGLDYAVC